MRDLIREFFGDLFQVAIGAVLMAVRDLLHSRRAQGERLGDLEEAVSSVAPGELARVRRRRQQQKGKPKKARS